MRERPHRTLAPAMGIHTRDVALSHHTPPACGATCHPWSTSHLHLNPPHTLAGTAASHPNTFSSNSAGDAGGGLGRRVGVGRPGVMYMVRRCLGGCRRAAHDTATCGGYGDITDGAYLPMPNAFFRAAMPGSVGIPLPNRR